MSNPTGSKREVPAQEESGGHPEDGTRGAVSSTTHDTMKPAPAQALANDAPDAPDLYLQEAYANIYNEITQPDKVFVATQYFRLKWVPLLGHSLAWLIIALRQHCYWNKKTGEMRNWCRITQDELAEEIGIQRRTVQRLLQHEYAGRFILEVKDRYRYDAQLRKQVREKSFYRIRMDDPLTPADEALLRQRLAEELALVDTDPETGQRDLLRLFDRLTADPDRAAASDLSGKMSHRSEPDDPDPPNPTDGKRPTPPEATDQAVPDPPPGPDLSDKMSHRSVDLADLDDKMSRRSGDLSDKMSPRSDHLGDKMSHISYGRQNVANLNSTSLVPENSEVQKQQQQYTPLATGGVGVSLEQLAAIALAADQVLVPCYPETTGDEPESVDPGPLTFAVQPLAEIVRRDVLAAAQGGCPINLVRHEVFYSVEHALNEGGDEWTPEEERRIQARMALERDLGAYFNRLGAFSLAEALQRYFSPELTDQFLAGKPAAERARIEGWVAYARQADGLTNPGGFLRAKIRSSEHPPPG